MHSIEIETAVAAHVMWSKRLQAIVSGISPDRLTPQFVGNYEACILGQWLYGEGRKYQAGAEYASLLEIHRRFHEFAAQIVTLHREGRDKEAGELLSGEFERLSEQVVDYLHRLQAVAA